MKLEYIVKTNTYATVKEVVLNYFKVSKRLCSKLKRTNQIFLNNTPVSINSKIKITDVVSVCLDFNETSNNIVPTQMNLDIIYEDDAFLIINKPAGIPVHPSIIHFENSLSNGVQYYFNSNNIKVKIHPVNRLDRNTSGLVIFAKNEYIQECLIQQMSSNSFKKFYLAILNGNIYKKNGIINAPISRKENSIIERTVSSNGQIAITHYKLIKNFSNICLVEFELKTGRTHQIRVHTSYIGHPILGDSLYGNTSSLISRQALHCHKICFVHPISNENLSFSIDLPDDMKHILNVAIL